MTRSIRAMCLASGLLAMLVTSASISDEPDETAALRLTQALSVVPETRPARPAPPGDDQPEALAQYYFVTYPELDTPPDIIPVLAAHYLEGHPERPMPPGLLDAMAHYYGALHPEKRPPVGLYSRLRAQQKLGGGGS